MSVASSGFLISLIWIIIFGIVVLILLEFGDIKRFGWYVWVTTGVSYFIAFTIIIMLPIDLASTKYSFCLEKLELEPNRICDEPIIVISKDFLYTFWQMFYWISFNIQMFVAPVMQGYCSSGSFTALGRIKDGIMDNVYFYLAVGAPGVIFILYAIFGANVPISLLLDLAIPAMNSYGLVLLVLLMSYGLVEIPRGLWFESSVDWKLRFLEFKVAALKESCVDSEAEMYEVAGLLALAAAKIPSSDPLRLHLSRILEKCPLALSERQHVPTEERDRTPLTETYLATLHARIKRAEYRNRREQVKLKSLYNKAFFYKDIINNRTNQDKIFESPFWGVTIPAQLAPYKKTIHQIAWWWYIYIQPISMKLLGVFSLVLSVLIIWSESTFQFSNVQLSIPAHILSENSSYFTIEILSIAFLCYMCTCTYFSLLKLKLFDFFEMVGDHMTNEQSLIFVGAYSCKLTFPLMYNYLNMGWVTTPAPGQTYESSGFPVFIQYLGPAVNMTPLLGEGYNDWVAFLILIVCSIFAFNLHNRIARIFGSKSYFLESMKDGNGDLEGRQIIETARGAELRRLARNDSPSRSAGGTTTGGGSTRVRNAADLLAKYNNQDRSNIQPQPQPVTKSTRAFGNFGFGGNGYSRVDDT